jgi:hypothetical protein
MSESRRQREFTALETELAWAFFMGGNHGSRSQKEAGCQLAMAESLAFDRIAFA